MRNSTAVYSWRALNYSAGYVCSYAKICSAVDEDTHIWDPAMINWAICFNVPPEKDVAVVEGKSPGLAPSAYPTGCRPHFEHKVSKLMGVVVQFWHFLLPPLGRVLTATSNNPALADTGWMKNRLLSPGDIQNNVLLSIARIATLNIYLLALRETYFERFEQMIIGRRCDTRACYHHGFLLVALTPFWNFCI